MGCASSAPRTQEASPPPPVASKAPVVNHDAQPQQAIKKAEVAGPLYASPAPAPNIPPSAQPAREVPSSPKAPALAKTNPEPADKGIGRPSDSTEDDGRQIRTQGDAERDEDEESNWDQHSTGHFDATDQALEACTLPEEGESPLAQPSVALRAQSSSLAASESTQNNPQPSEPLIEYRETTTMRVEKFKGCMFVNQYLVVKFLGRGACGKVFLCLNTLDLRLYAIKAVRKVDIEATQAQPAPGDKPRRNPMEDLKREILIMKRMKHSNIVMLNEVIDDPAGSKLLLVMEFMEGGPVLTREALEKREKLPEMLALQYFRDMVKPENVLMSATGEVKLSDFGCSKIFATGNEYLERCNGTPAFLAPEMMKPNTRFRGRPTDIYALGACLYTLVYGRIPFSAPNLYKLFQVVQNEPVRYPDDTPVTDALKNLLDAMLAKNPRDRITLPEIMKHPWVTMSGQFVLKSTRELKGEETQERHAQLANGRTFAECHPCPDYLSGLALVSQHERTFKEGDVIMRQGDAGGFLLYLMSGTVDVLVHWNRPGAPNAREGGGKGGAGGEGEFPDEGGEGVSPLMDEESYTHRTQLARAASKACDFVTSLQNAAGAVNELLIAQRGPGEMVGEMALFNKSQTRCATVRCNTAVTARIVTTDQLVAYLMEQPMAKHQIREGIWKKESEITIVDALVKLANAYDIINAPLQAAAAAAGHGVVHSPGRH